MIRIIGNKGVNEVEIEQIDNNRIRLQISDCSVRICDIIITAEVFSNFLTNLILDENKSLLEIMRSKLGWDEQTNAEYFKGCRDLWGK